MKQFTLPKTERLYLRESIGELFANGRTFTVFPYKVVYLVKDEAAEPQTVEENRKAVPNERQARCAVMTVAPKKRFKHAVDRNHIKRLTREAYRTQKLPLIDALTTNRRTMEAAFLYIDSRQIDFTTAQKTIGKAIMRLVKASASNLE